MFDLIIASVNRKSFTGKSLAYNNPIIIKLYFAQNSYQIIYSSLNSIFCLHFSSSIYFSMKFNYL